MTNKKFIIKEIDNVKVNIAKSSDPEKKYQASFVNPKTDRINTVHFGASSYPQYEDVTGLGIYTHENHNDKNRRDNYYSRHGKADKFSPKFFSHMFLWPK